MRILFRLALGVLLASSCLPLPTVEAQTCVESSDADYEFEVEASEDLTIYWTVDGEEITFQAVYNSRGWVSVGFSEDGMMVPGDCVIGLPDDGVALEYTLEAKSLDGVAVATDQSISGASVTQEAEITTLVFTRPLAPIGKVELSATEGDGAFFIWGHGSDNELAYHTDRGALELSDILCSTELSVDADDDDAVTDDDSVVTGDDDDVTAAGDNTACVSSDPDYTYEYSAGALTLFWSIVDSDTAVSVKAVYDGEGYVAIGFSGNSRMPESDAVIGLPDEATALEYDIPSYRPPEEADQQELTSSAVTQSGGTTTLTFIRPLAPTGVDKQTLVVLESTIWLYAFGSSNDFQQHSTEGSLSITLGSCDTSSTGLSMTKEFAHGWMMVLGWSVFMPLGIMAARFSGDFGKIGFPAHRALQSLGAFLVIIGFVIAIALTEDYGKDHFHNTHGKFGLVLTLFVMVQVLAAAYRPPAPKGGVDHMGNQLPAKPTTTRFVWSWGHRLLGYAAVILAIFQCLGGLDLLDIRDVWRSIYVVVVAILAALYAILFVVKCAKGGGQKGVKMAGNPVSDRDPERSGAAVHATAFSNH